MRRFVIQYHPSGLLALRRPYGIKDRIGFTMFTLAFIGAMVGMVGVAWIALKVCVR